jgi:hypothetical protein
MRRFIFSYIVLGILIAGCNLYTPAPSPTPPPANGGNIRLAQVQITPAPTQERVLQAIPTKTITPTPTSEPTLTPVPYACDVVDDTTRPARHISAVVNVDYATKMAHVDELITFVNREDTALDTIILDVQANQWQNGFVLEGLSVNDLAVTHELMDNRLLIMLPAPLAMGCQVLIKLSFRAQPSAIRDGLSSYRGFFGYSPRQLNIAHFLPTIAARIKGEWQLHEPIGIGEQIVYDIADWDVVISVENARESLQIAAPGSVVEIDTLRWQVTLPKSRDFAISMSEDFILHEKEVPGNVTVAIYTFSDTVINSDGSRIDGAKHALDETAKAITLFQELYGDYPYGRFVVVQGDFPDGMEFTGLVFVGTAWFYYFDGTQYNYLTLIGVHEVAHQWWYAKVGNDAALNPWLDEALATYSEYLFIEKYYPDDKNWWWTFRVADFYPQGDVDSSVYDFNTGREYINAVYLRGVQMLHNLREDIGDTAFFELLWEYSRKGEGQIATPALFWTQLTAEQIRQSQQTRNDFLGDPNVALFFINVEDDG